MNHENEINSFSLWEFYYEYLKMLLTLSGYDFLFFCTLGILVGVKVVCPFIGQTRVWKGWDLT